MMLGMRTNLIPAGAVLAALAAGCEVPEVHVIRAEMGPVESTVTSVEAGIVEPLQKAVLASPVSGRIQRIRCAEGDRVEASQVLVELENDLERLRMEQAGRELERLRGISEISIPEEFERARFAYERAKVEYDRTLIRATFPGIVAELNARPGEMTFGSFGLAAAGGLGEQEPLIYLVNESQLYVEAEIDEADVFRVAVGQPTTITLGGLDRRKIKGRLSSISPVVSTREGESRTADVRVELERPEPGGVPAGAGGNGAPEDARPAERGWGGVLVGMSADIEILVDRVESVLRVPTSTIMERGEERYVHVMEGEKVVRRRVVTGLGNWEMTEIREGLSPGDLVVVTTDVKSLEGDRRVRAVVDR
jgi:HlyD family secretion protein